MRMGMRKLASLVAILALLSSCGGGGGGGGAPPPVANPGTPPPPAGGSTCSLLDRQNWAFAQLNEWYLFPETLPANLDPAGFASVQAYIDALTATARAQGRDRFFTHITSIAEENAFFASGQTAGFGIRLFNENGVVIVLEAFEGAPALAAGIDRGTRIDAIGTSEANLQTTASLFAAGGSQAIINALGPSTAGTTRVLRVTDANGTRNLTVTKAIFDIPPVSPRYGVRTFDDSGRRVGYLNLRTFISTADNALRNAFAQFRAENVTHIVIDLRYNGGGLVSTAELFVNLLGRNRTGADVLSFTTFRASKAQFNETEFFSPQPQSVAPIRLAFIGTGSTASASELVINAMIPYLRTSLALVGANTFGKPVGQIAVDRAACDDRLRIVAFATQNRDNQGNYFNGLAGTVDVTCRAADNPNRQLGDALEVSTRQALVFLAGVPGTPLADVGQLTQTIEPIRLERGMLIPDHPTVAQREMPGFF
ncbi:MAG: S41 family peptidase [Sphingosinicella sp.]